MVTVDQIKNFLYLPCEVKNDDAMVESFIKVATVYVRNAADHFDELYGVNDDFTAQADLFITLYSAELYQNRNHFGGANEPSFLTRSLITQLQTY